MTNTQRLIAASAAAMVVYVCVAGVYRNYLAVLAMLACIGGVFAYWWHLNHPQDGPRG